MVEISFKRTQVRDAKYLMLGGSLIGPKVREIDRLLQIGPILLFRWLSLCCFSCAVGI